jgi:hypothetical protein
MLDIKDSVKKLISNVYECQKQIINNRRFIRDLLSEGNGNNISGLQNDIMGLQDKIIEFQKELRERFKYSY